jgi:hypothetical protein
MLRLIFDRRRGNRGSNKPSQPHSFFFQFANRAPRTRINSVFPERQNARAFGGCIPHSEAPLAPQG